jgi:hypothetical protein
MGTIKYFVTENAPLGASRIIEMRRADEVYLEGVRPRRWSAYQVFPEQGIRFFGLIEGDTRVSMCGLTPLTAFAYQIIGVETFAQNRRRQGNAKEVCAYALQERLRSAKAVPWSTSLRNAAGCKTAESLGFRPYYKLYVIESRIPRESGHDKARSPPRRWSPRERAHCPANSASRSRISVTGPSLWISTFI